MKRTISLLLAVICLLGLVACKEKSNEYRPIEWVYVTGLPETFPKLSDGITSAEENTATNATMLYWNVMEKSEFDGIVEKLEEWANAKVTETKVEGSESTIYTLETAEYTIKCTYAPKATGNHVEGALYDCQATVVVVKK